MARRAVRMRKGEPPGAATLLRRAAWVSLAGAWVFTVVALVGFDGADWPSTPAALHKSRMRKPCGHAGALSGWWGFHVLGIGAWVIIAGTGAWLGFAAAKRSVGHPLVRGLGLLVATAAVSAIGGLF